MHNAYNNKQQYSVKSKNEKDTNAESYGCLLKIIPKCKLFPVNDITKVLICTINEWKHTCTQF